MNSYNVIVLHAMEHFYASAVSTESKQSSLILSEALTGYESYAHKGRQSVGTVIKMADTMLQTLPAVTLSSLRDLG